MGNPLASHPLQRGHGWTKLPPPIHSKHSDPASVVPTSSLAMGSPVATTTLSTSSSGASLSSAASSSYSSPAQSFSSITPINTPPRVKWKARDAVAKRVQESDEEEELDDDPDDDDLDEFGYSSARRRAGQRETLLDILNSGPPNWMQNPSRESVADTSSPRVKKRSGLFARTKQSAGISSHQPSGGTGGTSESIAAALRKSIRLSRSSGSLFRAGRVGSLGNVVTGSTSRMTKAQEQAQAADEFARSLDPDTRKISLQMAESPGSESLMSFLRSSNPNQACYTPGGSSHIGSPVQLPGLKPSVGSSDKVQDVHDSAPSPTRVFFRDLKVALEGNPMMTSQRGKGSTAGAQNSSGEWDAGMPEDASLAAQWVSGDELSRVDSLGVAEEEILASPPRSDPSTPRHMSYTAEELEKSPGARQRSIIATSSAGGSPISTSSEGSSTTFRTTSQQSTSTARRISQNPIPGVEDPVPSLDHKPFERKYKPKSQPEDDTGPIATDESPIKGRLGSGSIASPGGDGSPFSRKSRHGVGSTWQVSDSSPCHKPRDSSKTPATSQSTKQGFPSVLPPVLSASSTSPSRTPVESESTSTSKLDAASDRTSETVQTTKTRPNNLIIPATFSASSTCAGDQEMPNSAGCSPESGSRRRPPRRITPPPKTPLPNAPRGSGAQVQASFASSEESPTKEEENEDSATDVVLEELPSGQSDGSSPEAWTSTREGQHSLSTPINDPKDASGVEVISAPTPMHPRLLSALIELRTSMGETATLDLPQAATTLELVLPTLCGMRTHFRNAINLLEVVIQLSAADHEGTEGNVVECLLGE